jgi:hypothetical protein
MVRWNTYTNFHSCLRLQNMDVSYQLCRAVWYALPHKHVPNKRGRYHYYSNTTFCRGLLSGVIC